MVENPIFHEIIMEKVTITTFSNKICVFLLTKFLIISTATTRRSDNYIGMFDCMHYMYLSSDLKDLSSKPDGFCATS